MRFISNFLLKLNAVCRVTCNNSFTLYKVLTVSKMLLSFTKLFFYQNLRHLTRTMSRPDLFQVDVLDPSHGHLAHGYCFKFAHKCRIRYNTSTYISGSAF